MNRQYYQIIETSNLLVLSLDFRFRSVRYSWDTKGMSLDSFIRYATKADCNIWWPIVTRNAKFELKSVYELRIII